MKWFTTNVFPVFDCDRMFEKRTFAKPFCDVSGTIKLVPISEMSFLISIAYNNNDVIIEILCF